MSAADEVRILLVDDDRTLLEYLSKRLQQYGFSVRATFSGEEALEVVINEDFDVAVVDLKMPGMDGLETQRRLMEVLPELQCIVLTAYGSIESALKSGQLNAYDYLFKPVEFESLVVSIRGAHEKKRKLEQIRKEQGEQANLAHDGAGRGFKGMWRALRRIYGVTEQ